MRTYSRYHCTQRLREELHDYDNEWWRWYDEFYDGPTQDYAYSEENYSYIEHKPYYLPNGRYNPYQVIDMNSFYSKEKLRDIKLDRILNNNEKDLTTTLKDFYNNGKSSSY